MAEHAPHPVENPEVVHETSDVNIVAILTFAGGLVALGGVIYLVVYLLFVYLDRSATRASADREYPLATAQEERLPPEPRLQTNPRRDLQDLRRSEDELLKSYQWVDRNNGIVRIPIDEAMKLTLQHGLPSRPATEQQVVK